MVEEIKPRHDAVFGMESLHHLFGHLLNVSNQRIVGRFRDFVGVDGAFQGVPIGAQCSVCFDVCGSALFLGRKAVLCVQEDKTGSRHIASFPRPTIGVVDLSHALVGCINHFGRGDGEVEHLDREDGVDEGLSPRVMRASDQFQQGTAEVRRDDFEVFKHVP